MRHDDDTPTIDPKAAAAVRGSHDVLLVDVRQPEEWHAGRIPGAVLIPLDELGDRLAELPRDRTIIAVCRSGARSGAATRFLIGNGFDAVNLVGGTIAWSRANLPLEPQGGVVA